MSLRELYSTSVEMSHLQSRFDAGHVGHMWYMLLDFTCDLLYLDRSS